MGSSSEHIVMLPMMAQGHLIPFLALARKIHQLTRFNITIATTPLNIQYLRSSIYEDSSPTIETDSSGIHLAELLPFGSVVDQSKPSNTDLNAENLPLDRMAEIFSLTTSLEAPFRRLLLDINKKEGRPPLCTISDIFMGWAVDAAKSVGTVNVTFISTGAYGGLAYFSLWLNLPHRQADCEEFTMPGFPDRCRFHISQFHKFIRMADGADQWSRLLQPQISQTFQSFGFLCHTAEEVEPHALEWFRDYIKLPVWAIGPLLPTTMVRKSSCSGSSISKHRAGKEPGISPERCVEWLDLQSPDSVLYVSFGSQNTISPSQMMELAKGLEDSRNPFIWVIRPPLGFDMTGEFKAEWLPEGFEECISKRKQGLLVEKWAPQLDILLHKSTGAFLSHCGWNSVLESLSQGVPIIGWPLAGEQAFNSKMLMEEMGVSVELTTGHDRAIEAKEVKKVIEMVMDKNGKGGEMRKKAVEIAHKIRAAVVEEGGDQKGSSITALEDFISAILTRRFS
ncbi:UDP-glycosyltransferase 92A1-like [Durio zibethinus]|uniref:Glycosyltransferase n=1 Tax=Durio zibethinus TaxID=66656 RepID=A0A6P5WW52_DURZI|nr:UDP-glycosyltransferase 92A1-like [Durio zibethinus]